MYHNSNNTTGQLLISFEQKANSQEEEIKQMFTSKNESTPSDIWKQSFKFRNIPITSVRRAMTNLLNEGILCKTNRKVPGLFGRPESIYQLSAVATWNN